MKLRWSSLLLLAAVCSPLAVADEQQPTISKGGSSTNNFNRYAAGHEPAAPPTAPVVVAPAVAQGASQVKKPSPPAAPPPTALPAAQPNATPRPVTAPQPPKAVVPPVVPAAVRPAVVEKAAQPSPPAASPVVVDAAARFEAREAALRAIEAKLGAREVQLNAREARMKEELARYERDLLAENDSLVEKHRQSIQKGFDQRATEAAKALQQRDQELSVLKADVAMLQRQLNEATQKHSAPAVVALPSDQNTDSVEDHYRATKAELISSLRSLKLRSLIRHAEQWPPMRSLPRKLAEATWELKRELIEVSRPFIEDELESTTTMPSPLNVSWISVMRACYFATFGKTKIGFCAFMCASLFTIVCWRKLRQISYLALDQRALADRQQTLLGQMGIINDEVKRVCYTTNRYCENAINELRVAGEVAERTPKVVAPTHDYSQTINRFESILMTGARESHLVYLEWLLAGIQKDLVSKLDRIEDKVDLANLQLSAVTECVYNDSVQKLESVARALPLLNFVVQTANQQTAVTSGPQANVQSASSALSSLSNLPPLQTTGGSLPPLVSSLSGSVGIASGIKFALDKCLDTCPLTEVLQEPRGFEDLYGTMDTFRKIVFGILNALPASSADITHYVAQLYDDENTCANANTRKTSGRATPGEDTASMEQASSLANQSTDDPRALTFPHPLEASRQLKNATPTNHMEFALKYRDWALSSLGSPLKSSS